MLNPPFLKKYSRQSRSPCVTKGGTFYYPYFLAYATGVLEKNNLDVKLIDAVANEWTHKQTLKFVKKYNPELVVIDTSTPSINNDIKVSFDIKNILSNSHVTLVGTHPTALPEQVLKSCKADSICRSEYDFTIKDLAVAIEKKKSLKSILGISYKQGKRIIHNKSRPLIKNLDEIPFVSVVYKKHFGKEGIKKYFYASVSWPQVTLLTARGCPYNCSFCNSPFKHSYRPRSKEDVVEEFEYIQSELPFVKEVMVEDETFPAVKKRTIDLCNLMKEREIKLKWSANARVNTDFETLKIMKNAGCRLLCVGFESPEQSILNVINKKTTKQMQIDFMNNCRKVGILVNGCFMLGLLNDTKKSIRKTVEFAKKLNPDTAQFYPIMVYPGTLDYKIAKEKGYLITEDYSKWLTPDGQHTTTVSRPDLSAEELMKLCNQARREFYLRGNYIINKLFQSIVHPSEGLRTLKSVKVFFKHLK